MWVTSAGYDLRADIALEVEDAQIKCIASVLNLIKEIEQI